LTSIVKKQSKAESLEQHKKLQRKRHEEETEKAAGLPARYSKTRNEAYLALFSEWVSSNRKGSLQTQSSQITFANVKINNFSNFVFG